MQSRYWLRRRVRCSQSAVAAAAIKTRAASAALTTTNTNPQTKAASVVTSTTFTREDSSMDEKYGTPDVFPEPTCWPGGLRTRGLLASTLGGKLIHMVGRGVPVMSALVVTSAWVVCAISYATDGGGSYNDGVFSMFALLAVALTTGSAIAITEAWKGTRGMVVAPLLSAFAVAAILWLALALRLRG